MAEESNPITAAEATINPLTKPVEAANEDKPTDASVAGDEGNTAAEETKTNGEVEHAANAASDEAPSAKEDTGMKDTEDPAVAGSSEPAAAAPAQSTPTSSKKTTNGSNKKKSAGVPEHKTKKLNKKKSQPKITHLDAEPGELYLARMKGHAAWPSIICDEEMLPQSLIDSRPVTTKLADGTFKKPEYAEGGKRAFERTFPIMFLHTNEFAWLANTDLTPLDPTTCSNVDSKGKTKALLAAYEKASENQSLDHYKSVLQDHQAAVQADAEAQAERETKKAGKGKRKSNASALAEGEDEMDVDEEEPAPKPKSKKRKKEVESDEGEEKPAKTPKTATKVKLSAPKTPASEPSSRKKAAKPKSSGKKSAAKAMSDDDEEAVDTPKEEEKPMTEAEKEKKKETTVLYLRHKLQRGFLSRDTTPKEEEMKGMSELLGQLENHPDLEGSIIRSTKIHKVLKAMIKLPSIPLDEEFHFKTRSHGLLQKWNEILAGDSTVPVSMLGAPEPQSVKPRKNKGTEKQAEEAEAGKAAAPEEEKDEEIENKIGTTTEGEKEAEKEAEKESEKPNGTEKVDEPVKTDAPAVDSAPAEEYKPPAATTDDEPAA